jgi:hypothetical protein
MTGSPKKTKPMRKERVFRNMYGVTKREGPKRRGSSRVTSLRRNTSEGKRGIGERALS